MRRLRKTIFTFAAISVLVALAGIIYTIYGRGVTSSYMSFAFVYPLAMGLLFNVLLLAVQKRLPFVGTVGYRLYSNLYNSGIATLTVCSVLMGILDIADNSSNLTGILFVAGIVISLAGLSVLILLLQKVRRAIQMQKRRKARQQVRSE